MRKAKCPECGCRFTPEETVKVKRKILPVADRTFTAEFEKNAMYGTLTIDGEEILVYLGSMEAHCVEGHGLRKFVLVEV